MPLNGNLGNKVLPLMNSSTLPFEISTYKQNENVRLISIVTATISKFIGHANS